MTQPARRRSSLSGASPLEPPQQARAAEDSTTEVRSLQRLAPVRDPNAASATSERRKYPPKVSFYQNPEDTARVRGAILHTMTREGSRTLSQFIDHAVMVEVERLEAKYNDGQPFPPVAARELPQGRPMGG